MFGIYRTILAVIVVIHHLGYIPIVGHFSVHGFFILSGFLMTTIMHEKYHYTYSGMGAFFVNRILRLYPQNFVMLAISCLAVAYYGNELSSMFRSHLYMPDTITSWLQNLLLVYSDLYPNSVSPRLLPPTWALTVELFFYLLIGLGLSKNKMLTIFWSLTSILYFVVTHLYGLPYRDRYSSLIAGSLGFSLGAVLYHYKSIILSKFTFFRTFPAFAFFSATIVNMFLGGVCHYLDFEKAFYFFFYMNYLLNILTILALLKVHPTDKMRNFDSKVGEYSYPLYLIHWPIGLIISMTVFSRPITHFSLESITVTILSCMLALVISFFTIKYVDKPVEKLRRKLKDN